MLSRQVTHPWRQQSTESSRYVWQMLRVNRLLLPLFFFFFFSSSTSSSSPSSSSFNAGGTGAGERTVLELFTGRGEATRAETCRGRRRRVRVTNFKRTFLIKVNVRTASSPESFICWTTMTWSRSVNVKLHFNSVNVTVGRLIQRLAEFHPKNTSLKLSFDIFYHIEINFL